MDKLVKNLNKRKFFELTDTSSDKENESQNSGTFELSDETIDELTKPKTKRICLPLPILQTKPKLTSDRRMGRKSEFELECIGSGWSKHNMDSAGHKFDSQWFARQQYRQLLTDALTKDDLPLGASNQFALAVRIESRLFRLLNDNVREYRRQCISTAHYLTQEKNRKVRDQLLLGRIEPNEFVFMPINDKSLKNMIDSKIKLREDETQKKMNILKDINK